MLLLYTIDMPDTSWACCGSSDGKYHFLVAQVKHILAVLCMCVGCPTFQWYYVTLSVGSCEFLDACTVYEFPTTSGVSVEALGDDRFALKLILKL